MKKRMLFQLGVLSLSIVVSSVFAARLATPVAALAQSTAESGSARATGDMSGITARMERRLARNAAMADGDAKETADRAYVGAMSAISPAIVALCKKEIAIGKNTSIKAAAAKILSVGQEQERWIAEYEREFHIEHSP